MIICHGKFHGTKKNYFWLSKNETTKNIRTVLFNIKVNKDIQPTVLLIIDLFINIKTNTYILRFPAKKENRLANRKFSEISHCLSIFLLYPFSRKNAKSWKVCEIRTKIFAFFSIFSRKFLIVGNPNLYPPYFN